MVDIANELEFNNLKAIKIFSYTNYFTDTILRIKKLKIIIYKNPNPKIVKYIITQCQPFHPTTLS
jgi:hypothetical protein